MCFFVCGVLPFSLNVVTHFLTAFYGASAFNQDLSKWETGKVTTMFYSKCTLLGVVVLFQKKNRRLTLLFVFWGDLLWFLCVGCCRFSLNVVTHSLKRFVMQKPSMQICPSGKRLTSPLCHTVSVLFSVLLSFSKQEYSCTCIGDSHFLLFFGDLMWFRVGCFVVLFDALVAAFEKASVFNADISKWEMGKVTNMGASKCTFLGVVFLPNKQ